jgi:hypothetical protein
LLRSFAHEAAVAFALSKAPCGGVSPLQQLQPRDYEHDGADTLCGDPDHQGREARAQGQQIPTHQVVEHGVQAQGDVPQALWLGPADPIVRRQRCTQSE